MTKQLRFDNHAAFHGQVLRVTVVAAGLGLLGHIASRVMTLSGGGAIEVLKLTLIAALLGLAANPPKGRQWLGVGLMAGALSLIGALALQALATSPPVYPWFGVCVYGLAVGFIAGRDLRDYRRWVLPLATGLSVLLATWVKAVFIARLPLTDYVPSFLAEPIYGAAFGFLVATGLVARQLRFERDKVLAAFERIRGSLSGEILELCERGVATYRRTKEALRDREDQGVSNDPKLTRGVESLMLRIVALGRRWQEVEREANRTSADALTDRLAELEDKIAHAQDPVARRQYEKAKDALGAQLGYLRDISRNRERVTARVHNYLAALERLHLAVLNHQGADAAKFSDELQPLLDEIDDYGVEIDIASEALTEAAEVTSDVGSNEERDEGQESPVALADASDASETPEDDAEASADDADEDAEASKEEAKAETTDPEVALQRGAFE